MSLAKKLYYKIGEACKLLEIQPYVLRYWETEFPALSPSKSRSGQRVYSERELTIIRRIKQLLYEEGYTIAGAKKRLESELEGSPLSLETGSLPIPVLAPSPDAVPDLLAAQGPLDTRGDERVETLRRGIGRALDEARSILLLLDSSPKRSQR